MKHKAFHFSLSINHCNMTELMRQQTVIPSVISIHEKWCIACHFNNITTTKKPQPNEEDDVENLKILS